MNCILVVLSDTKMPCMEIFFLNCYIVKIILVSLNCFSEYIIMSSDAKKEMKYTKSVVVVFVVNDLIIQL